MSYNILIIDDSKEFIAALKCVIYEVLGNNNCFIDFALNGEIGIRMASQQIYEYIFIDIDMPGLGGIETAKIIDKEYYRSIIKIVAVSSHSEFAYKCQMLGAGARMYLVKDEINFDSIARIFDLQQIIKSSQIY